MDTGNQGKDGNGNAVDASSLQLQLDQKDQQIAALQEQISVLQNQLDALSGSIYIQQQQSLPEKGTTPTELHMKMVNLEQQLQQTPPITRPKTVPKPPPLVEVPVEQVQYANLLFYCSWAGVIILVVTFVLYATGIMHSVIPPNEVSQYWGMKLSDYLAVTGAPTGWAWLGMLNKGDFVTLVGVALLGLVSLVGYAFILLPIYARKKDVVYAVFVSIEVIVLVLAASGVIKLGAT